MVDISFECDTGLNNTKLIKRYLDEFPYLRPLALIIKYYLKLCYLNDTWTGGIGSYTLLVLIIFYLQRYTSSKDDKEDSKEDNLAHILTGFLDFYGNKFDYTNNVISIIDGGKYLTKVEKDWVDVDFPDRLSVEDPQNVMNDLGRSSFNIEKAKLAFQKGYELLSESISNGEVSESFVSRLIHVPHEELKLRHSIKMKYNKGNIKKKNKLSEDGTKYPSPVIKNVHYVNSNDLNDKKQKDNDLEEDYGMSHNSDHQCNH